jgi:hypothetical protein
MFQYEDSAEARDAGHDKPKFNKTAFIEAL